MKTKTIEVGDIITYDNAFMKGRYKVHRVTKTLAFVWLNDRAEGKYKRELGFNDRPIPVPRIEWDTTRRTHIAKDCK